MWRVEARRARRIRITLELALRRRAEHLKVVHRGDVGAVDCACELANTYFAKRRPIGCNCRKRARGAPRRDAGMCNAGERDRIYGWRREDRECMDAVRAGRLPEEPDRVWPRGGKGPGTFALEVRDVRTWKGRKVASVWSTHHRRYRTEAGRDAALRHLTHKDRGVREYRAQAAVPR